MKHKTLISIGFKLTTIVSLLLVLSLGGLTLLASLFFSEEVERTLRSSTLEQVDLVASKIESELEAAVGTGKLLAASLDGGLVYRGTQEPATADILRANPRLRDARILRRPEGVLELHAKVGESYQTESPLARSPSLEDLDRAFGTALDRAFAGELIIANLSPEYAEAVLGIALPWLMQSDTKADSVLVLVWAIDAVLDALASRELRENLLVDARGNLLAHSSRERVLARESLLEHPLVRDALAGETSLKQLQYIDSSGTVSIGSWRRFFDGTIYALSSTDRDAALEGVRFLRQQNVFISVIILCVAIIFLLLFSKTLTVPLKQLVSGAMRIGEGDFSMRVVPKTRDEIGRLAETFNSMATGLEERDKIKSAFGKFVNKDIADKVLKGEIQLGGESRTVSIFFSDIRSFTAISEQLSPHEVVTFLNEYLSLMVGCVNRTHGVVDKFIGDAIMATWGVPTSRGNDTENAIISALCMRKALASFNRSRGVPGKPIIKIGCGINTGEVIVGQIGSTERMEYTCIGDAVNLASRIESLNKLFHTDILISQKSYELVRDIFVVEPMRMIHVKGKAQPLQIYAVLGRRADPDCPRSVEELRAQLGLDPVDLDSVDPDREERKYEIVREV